MTYPLNSLIDGMDFETYLADPAPHPSLQSSDAKAITSKTPAEVFFGNRRLNTEWVRPDSDDKFDLGTAFHAHLMKVGEPIEVLEFADWRTNAAKAARQEAWDAGRTPMLKHQWGKVEAMATAFWGQADQVEVRDGLSLGDLCRRGLKEQTVIWEEDGVLCRARPDIYDEATGIIIHLKTTGQDFTLEDVDRYMANAEWDITGAHYEACGAALTGERPLQIFPLIKTHAPHPMLSVTLGEAFLSPARKQRQKAMNIWGRCLTTNWFPGFPKRLVMIEAPEWHERKKLDREERDEAARSAGHDILDISAKIFAPEGWNPPAVPSTTPQPSGADAELIED